jgi:hypothetical protein
MYEFVVTSEGAVVDLATAAMTSAGQHLQSILVHIDTAPTTAGTLTVTLDSGRGSSYDTIVYARDLLGVTDIAYTGIDFPLDVGDRLRASYANANHRTIGVRLVLE